MTATIVLDDNYYAQYAQTDKDWQQLCASAKIEGIVVDPRDEALAGRFLCGVITQDQWGASIKVDHENSKTIA